MSDRYLGLVAQGEDEEIPYSVVTTATGSSPTSVAVKVYDVAASYEDVTATVMPGSPTVDGDSIKLPALKGLSPGRLYRVEVKFAIGDAVYEVWFEVSGER